MVLEWWLWTGSETTLLIESNMCNLSIPSLQYSIYNVVFHRDLYLVHYFLYIIYTNDLSKCLSLTKAIIFADDTTIYLSSNDIIYLYQSINTDFQSLTEWFRANKLSLNVGKTNFVLFISHKCASISVPCHLRIKIGNDEIERKSTVLTVKFLGMHIDSKLEWHEHIKFIQHKLSSGLYAMNKVKHLLSNSPLSTNFVLFPDLSTY